MKVAVELMENNKPFAVKLICATSHLDHCFNAVSSPTKELKNTHFNSDVHTTDLRN